jgi:hypothetical protein
MNDFSIGLQYIINKNTGRCILSPLRKRDIDIDDLNSDFNSAIDIAFHLQSNQDFVYQESDANYVYIGLRERNGIPSDVFLTRIGQKNYEYAFSDVNLMKLFF